MSVAETVGPSVRGALRAQVVAMLALSGALTGALAGFVAGGAWAAATLPAASPTVVLVVTAVAVALELVGRPRPPALRQQVPQLWGRLFGPRTVAVLYGARLGVGPLTVLPTWLWWAAFVLAATAGPWPAAAIGALYAVTRTAFSTLATIGVGDAPGMARRMATFRRLERRMVWGAAVVVAGVALAACSNGSDGGGRADAPGRDTSDRTTPTLELEPSTTTTTTPEDDALSDLLIDDALPGLSRADEALGAGPLDLEAAASAEVDEAAERALLETRRFVRGTSRAWLGPNGDVAYVAIYEFADAAGAEGYLEDGTETLLARGAAPFEVPGVEGARGFSTVERGESGSFTAHAAAFTRGARWVLVLVGSETGSRTPEEATELAAAQAERVPTE